MIYKEGDKLTPKKENKKFPDKILKITRIYDDGSITSEPFNFCVNWSERYLRKNFVLIDSFDPIEQKIKRFPEEGIITFKNEKEYKKLIKDNKTNKKWEKYWNKETPIGLLLKDRKIYQYATIDYYKKEEQYKKLKFIKAEKLIKNK